MKIAKLIPLFLILGVAAIHAATLDVTTTADSGAGSLRNQVAAAASGDTIAISATGTIALTTGQVVITGKNLDIVGPGATSLTITTNATTRALKIINAQCSISGITFHNCKGLPGDIDTGGAIAVDNFTSGGGAKVTTINDCAFTNNQSGWGGALDIFNGGLNMNRCTFSGNSATGVAFSTAGGGGALSIGATVASTITNSTFSANSQNGSATGQPGGGAVYNYGSGTASPPAITFEHCTFVGNLDASGAAGAIKGNYTGSYHTWANLKSCLLVDNQAPVSALRNFAGASAGPLTTAYASLGGNATDEAATSAEFMAGGDTVASSTLAGSVSPTLGLNGGATKTHAITRGSPAQRTGLGSTVSTDQRGAPRHANADAGAFELIEPELGVSVAAAPLDENGTLDFGSTAFDTPVVVTVTLTNTQTSAFTTGSLVLGNASAPAGFSLAGFPAVALANGESADFDITLSAADTGLFNAALTFTGNDAFNPALATLDPGSPNLHLFTLAALVTDTINHWREVHFGPGATNSGNAADTAFPAGDGISNLIKYVLNLDPMIPEDIGEKIVVDFDEAGCLRMTVTRNPAATDVVLTIEGTEDLAHWNSTDTIVDMDTLLVLQAHSDAPFSTLPRNYLRLNATRN